MINKSLLKRRTKTVKAVATTRKCLWKLQELQELQPERTIRVLSAAVTDRGSHLSYKPAEYVLRELLCVFRVKRVQGKLLSGIPEQSRTQDDQWIATLSELQDLIAMEQSRSLTLRQIERALRGLEDAGFLDRKQASNSPHGCVTLLALNSVGILDYLKHKKTYLKEFELCALPASN